MTVIRVCNSIEGEGKQPRTTPYETHIPEFRLLYSSMRWASPGRAMRGSQIFMSASRWITPCIKIHFARQLAGVGINLCHRMHAIRPPPES